jgi:hypothetical protein
MSICLIPRAYPPEAPVGGMATCTSKEEKR